MDNDSSQATGLPGEGVSIQKDQSPEDKENHNAISDKGVSRNDQSSEDKENHHAISDKGVSHQNDQSSEDKENHQAICDKGVSHRNDQSSEDEENHQAISDIEVTQREERIPVIIVQNDDGSDLNAEVTQREERTPVIIVQNDDGSDLNAEYEPENATTESEETKTYKKSKLRLRKMLKLYFYTAVKYKKPFWSFHFVYFLFMLIQIAKLSCITTQMFAFGDEREKFNNVVKRGDVTLKNLLLKDWDASWETPPYPPAQGDFAVYEITSLKEKINYAVEKLYNAEEDAIGFYKRPRLDSVHAEMRYFDFDGFKDGDTFHGISIKTKTFTVHVSSHRDRVSNKTRYSYDVDTDFHVNHLTEPVKRMLTFKLMFKIESVRVFIDRKKARCLVVDGQITFQDPDNNGQVIVDIDTTTEAQRCLDLGYDVPDVTIEAVSKNLIGMVLCLAFISLFSAISCMAFGVYVCFETKHFMKKYYVRYFDYERYLENLRMREQPGTSSQESCISEETDLPRTEYLRFIKGWDILLFVSDLVTIFGNFDLETRTDKKWTVASLDTSTVFLGIGCLISWIVLLRYLKFNYKFQLLFKTMYASIGDVLAYLACICLLFVGYMTFGYVVLGPYHIKFETASATAETLISIVNGDEIYATFALFQSDQTGGNLVPVIYKIYLGSFIAIFTIIVLNLLIALFTNAYDAIKRNYEEPEDTEDGPLESALKQVLISDEKDMTKSAKDLFQSGHKLSVSETHFKRELQKALTISKRKHKFILKKPKTIKAFILATFDPPDKRSSIGGDQEHKNRCCRSVCLFGWSADDAKGGKELCV